MEKINGFFTRTRFQCLASLFGLTYCLWACATTQWQNLAQGLDYTTLSAPPISSFGKLHAFRIDLKYYDLDWISAKEFSQSSAKVYYLAKKSDALLAINGGFFDPDFSPLGLRVKQGKILNPLKPISWWGIFEIKNNHASITTASEYHADKKINFAMQSGPRLLINGAIPTLKPGLDERSALCITHDGKVIIMATENAALTTTELATLIKENEKNEGLNCYNALNLDGGSSTQLYALIGDFSLNIFSFADIADSIVVKKK